MTPLPMYMRTAEARWWVRLPILPPALRSNCAMCTSRNPVWRIFFCITREGACAIELDHFSSSAGARCSCRSPQHGAFAPADFLAADDVCVYFRSRDGVERLHRSEEHTSELQSPCNLVCR